MCTFVEDPISRVANDRCLTDIFFSCHPTFTKAIRSTCFWSPDPVGQGFGHESYLLAKPLTKLIPRREDKGGS